MENTPHTNKPATGKTWVGLIFLVIGLIMFTRTLGLYVPGWVTSWPMYLIVAGCFTGYRNDFKNPVSYILIFIGGIFLIDRIFDGIDLHNFLWPVFIIGIGVYMITGKKKNWKKPLLDNPGEWDKRVDETGNPVEPPPVNPSHEDVLDAVSIFGGIKRTVVSKSFKGGEVTAIMGGVEINLTQADIHGRVILDVTQLFGGTKIIVPPQWKISSEGVAVFGGLEDKRAVLMQGAPLDDKHLVIRGTTIFGGIDIRSF
jgi:predicted membrane protein